MKLLDSEMAQTMKARVIPFYRLFPSIITILALCMGITAVRYALDGKFEIAAGLIIIAGIMDGMDGRIARLLKSTSEFGAQLDSLADVVSFGVAPSVVTYLWILRDIPNRGVGWLVVLVYISCAALRLARFNVQSIGTQPGSYCDKNLDLNKSDDEIVVERPINIPIIKSYRDRYGTGVLMPAAAALCLTPMIMSFEWLREYRFNPYVIAVYVLFVGILMISTVPTFLIKNIGVEHRHIKPILLLCAAIIAGLLLEPWLIIPPLSLCYLLSMPIIMVKVRNMRGNR